MFTYRILVGLTALLAFAAAAEAGVLAAGPIWGGVSQVNATCYVMNVGIQDVRIDSVTIRGQSGGVIEGQNFCGTVLRKGAGCHVFVPITNGQAHSCSVSLRNNLSSDNLRGTLDIRGNTSVVLAATPLR